MDHRTYLEMALDEARIARGEGAMPVGAVVVDANGVVLGRGHNVVLPNGDPTAHAEISAIRSGGAGLIGCPSQNSGNTIYTTSEPCLMCLGAMLVARINVVVWAANSAIGGALDSVLRSGYCPHEVQRLTIIREPVPSVRREGRALLREYYRSENELERVRWLSDAD